MTTIILLFLLIIIGITNIVLNVKKTTADDQSGLMAALSKIETEIARIDTLIRGEFSQNRKEYLDAALQNRQELSQSFTDFGTVLSGNITRLSDAQSKQFILFSNQLSRLVGFFGENAQNLQTQLEKSAKDGRKEQSDVLKSFEESFKQNVKDLNELQKRQFGDLIIRQESVRKDIEEKLKEIRETVEHKLKGLQEDNNQKLEEMRKTVDEKLQATVEKRFNESFKLISEQLDKVHKGLGEMQTLASGVGDLKKVLSNVKTRGNLGEIQLGAILEQILSPEQYIQNATVKEGSLERVEYAIKFPGKNDNDTMILLPIDSKFPTEDYQRLLEAYDNSPQLSAKELENAAKQFENAVKKNAKDIHDKYINVPLTTDFAIMFVPTEGLYAEVLRRTGLFESLQRDYKITVVGPTNLVAFLSSLQMGFKTLAIEKRSGEVWTLLGAVKTEFGQFGSILEKTKKKLQEATNVIDKAGVRSRAIENKLRKVQMLPQEETSALLENTGASEDLKEEEEEDSFSVNP